MDDTKEYVIQRMVSDIVEDNKRFISVSKEKLEGFKTILPVLLKKGIDNLNLTMFDDSLRSKIIATMGDEYCRKGNFSEAIKCFILTGDRERLTEIALEYEKVGNRREAINDHKVGFASRASNFGRSACCLV